MTTKDDIRQMVRQKRRELSADFISQASLGAQRRLLSLPEFSKSASVCCYKTMAGEAGTDLIFEECWVTGKTVCVPVYFRATGEYRLSRITRETPMVLSHFDILEPVEHAWMDAADVDLVVVPGLAFDKWCGRVGHGRGYYDRILAGAGGVHPVGRPFKAGLAFDWQLLPDPVPMEASDVWMDVVVTEERIIRRVPA